MTALATTGHGRRRRTSSVNRSSVSNAFSNPSSAIYSDYLDEDATNTSHGDNFEESIRQKREIKRASTRTTMIALVLVMLGAIASGAFLYLGITEAKDDQQSSFERRANDLASQIVSSFRDYENAALWIHQACRDWRTNNMTRADFRDLYHYIISEGIDFFLMEWVPNITNAERPILEAEATEYYANDTNVDYGGFVGIEANPEDPEEIGLFPRSERPFYFPVHFLEPYERIGVGQHLDLYTIPYEQHAINEAIRTFKVQLTERFEIVSQGTDGYSVSLIHPGIPLPPGERYREPKDLALFLIHIRSLLERAAKSQRVTLAAYLYDATKHLVDPDSVQQDFLGGASIEVVSSSSPSSDDNNIITYFNETELDAVKSQAPDNYYYEETLEVGSRTWTIVIVPVEGDDSFEPVFTFAILTGVMIFAAALLLAWVWVMHNQQRTKHTMDIVDKAAAESKIVSNLYPQQVREHMINQQQQQQQSRESAKPTAKDVFMNHDKGAGEFNLFNNSTETNDNKRNDGEISSEGLYKTKPIANRYEATTIMFADLAGFTAWSSSRSPEDVFTLLETLYGAFDNIAKRRRVFKVETIGDCYVAVAGLPKPRSDHAEVMCKFANDCLHKMQKLTKVLAEGRLGAETTNLCFRVGLHSGPVTAGVLRGDKGRFQLFGDTMNTASRMESTGVKNKIQVSQETADLLIAGGRQKWVVPREEMIEAKGKGTIQTYFVTVGAGSTSSSRESESTRTTAMMNVQKRHPFSSTATVHEETDEEEGAETFHEEYSEVIYI